jgi:CDP-glucose 4,6-dehydratase
LIPDIVRSVASGQDVVLRHPASRRPWQHVLDPLWGYLLLGARLLQSPSDPTFTDAFNFGPDASANWPVERVTSRIIELWGDGRYRVESSTEHPHEAGQLHLDASRARRRLGWQPNLPIDDALAWTVDWYRAWSAGDDLRDLTESQIDEYLTRSVGP